MDFYDPAAAYNYTSTALLALIVASTMIFVIGRLYPDWAKRRNRQMEIERETELAQIAAKKEVRLKEVELFQSQFNDFEKAIHRRLDEIEDNRINEMSSFIKDFIANAKRGE